MTVRETVELWVSFDRPIASIVEVWVRGGQR